MPPNNKVAGVIGIFTDENGNVIANAADFKTGSSAGITRQEAQTWRVRRRLAFEVIRAYASPQLTRAMRDIDADGIVSTLVAKHGCKITIIPIGAEEKPDA